MGLSFKIIIALTLLASVIQCRDISFLPSDIIEDIVVENNAGCSININGGLPSPQPLLIIAGTNHFYLPQSRDGIVWLEHGEQLELFCSTRFSQPSFPTRSINISCGADNMFEYNKERYTFNLFNCSSQVTHAARRSGRTCYNGNTHIEVGFNVDTRFLNMMDICHDEILGSTLYSYYIQTPANAGFQVGFPRPSAFINGIFYNNKNVNNFYTRNTQIETLGRVLGEEIVDDLISRTSDIYLARGHIAAKVDYIYGSQQRATFYFVNVAPQWQRFNAANWERVERNLRNTVANRNWYTEIYTGTHGILQLRDRNGTFQEIFLHYDENNNGFIPVPKLFYKVVIEPSTGRGVVFLGVNNPHATREEILKDYVICHDIAHLINWMTWDKEDISKGYSYACDVNEFARVVGHLPVDVRTTGLLL